MVKLNARFNVTAELTRPEMLQAVGHYLEADAMCVIDMSRFVMDGSAPEQILELENGSLHVSDYEDAMTAVFTRETGNVRTVLSVVLRDKDEQPSVNIRVEQQSTGLSLPEQTGRYPVPLLVKELFWNEFGAKDRELETKDSAFVVHKAEAGMVARLVKSKGEGLVMPVVLVSVDKSGKPGLDKDMLAEELTGQAHVLVEGNPLVSAELDRQSKGTDIPKDGQVGILVPGYGMTVLGATGEDLVIDTIRDALNNATVPDAFDPEKLKQKYLRSRMGGDPELKDMFDLMLAEQEARNVELSKQVFELQTELEATRAQLEKRRESGSDAGSAAELAFTETELYDGEIKDVILKALEQARNQMDGQRQKLSRKYHVLTDLLEHNERTGRDEELTEVIRKALADGTLSREGIALLRSAGFKVTKDDRQGHYKVTFGEGDRYTGVHGATPGDLGRSGKNFTTDLANMLFWL